MLDTRYETRVQSIHQFHCHVASTSGYWVEFDLPFENVDQGARLLLGIGPEVKVIGPPDLREAVRDMARAVLARLGG